MNKGWLIIVISLFLTAVIWTGFDVYSCLGGFSNKVFGVNVSACSYDNSEIDELLVYEITPIPETLKVETISDIKTKEGFVIIKDKSQL